MSVEAMSHVWKTSRHKGSSLVVLLAIADHAHPDGTGAWAGVETLARMARIEVRSISRILVELEESGELVIQRHAGPRRTHKFSIPMVGTGVMPWADARRRPDDLSTPTQASREPYVTRTDRDNEGTGGSLDTGDGVDNLSTSFKEPPGAPPKLSPRQEAKKIEDLAVKLWRDERRRRLGAQARYLDAPAIESMRRFGLRPALAAGHIWTDLARAIYDHAGERGTAPPWKIHEWADAARAKRLDEEQAQHALEARRHRDDRTPPDLEELRLRHPGKSLREILALEGGGSAPSAPRSISALLPQLRVVTDEEGRAAV